MDNILFRCSECKGSLKVDARWAGRAITCPRCRRTIQVPALPAEWAATSKNVNSKVLQQIKEHFFHAYIIYTALIGLVCSFVREHEFTMMDLISNSLTIFMIITFVACLISLPLFSAKVNEVRARSRIGVILLSLLFAGLLYFHFRTLSDINFTVTEYYGPRLGAICNDGWRSRATGRGACSHHGGVARWIRASRERSATFFERFKKHTQEYGILWLFTLSLPPVIVFIQVMKIDRRQEQTEIKASKAKYISLRSQSLAKLSPDAAQIMLRKKGFFDLIWNKQNTGLIHKYRRAQRLGGTVIIDHLTHLIWQQSGSIEKMKYITAQEHIRNLNNQKFAGYDDWRLPTLEEAMSLMEPTEKNAELHIDPVFDKKQRWIWTADKQSAGVAWYVNFDYGDCSPSSVDYGYYYVRAVRSGQSGI